MNQSMQPGLCARFFCAYAIVKSATNHAIAQTQKPFMEKTITYSRIIHLSHIIHPGIPRWSGDPAIEFETVAERDRDGYYLRRFSLGEHSATHINAPASFAAEGATIDQYPADACIVPAVVIDICDRAAVNSDYALTIEDVLHWEEHHQQIPPGSIVLLFTGWQGKWSDPDAFLNQQHFPGFAGETTQFLLQQRQIAGVGIDTHGVDPGQDSSFTTNREILANGGIVLENLTHLDQLPPIGATLMIGILRLQKGSGSPAAVLAFLP